VGSSNSIAMVRATGFGDLPDRLERLAGERRLIDTFEREGLPLAVRDMPTTPMPLRSMIALFARSSAILDNRTLGLEVGESMRHAGYGLWIAYCTGAPTLGEALRRAVTTSWAHQVGARLELAGAGDHVILRFVTPAVDVAKTTYADHLLPPMQSLARLYLGSGWRPDWVEVDYARDPHAARVEERLQVPMRFQRPGSGIAFRRSELSGRRNLDLSGSVRIVTLRDVLAEAALASAPEPARALSAVVALRLLDGQSDIEGAARLVGLGVQGLQRRLRQKGYTYREVVDEARRARAIRLLLETSMTALAIALSLGYETPASFTRAFARWTGCTPSEFRRAQGVPASG